jgi:hypothetical protein
MGTRKDKIRPLTMREIDVGAARFLAICRPEGERTMRNIKVWPAWLALAATAGACTTIATDFEQAQPVVFEFKQAGTQCEVKRGSESFGKVSASNATLRVQKNLLPLELNCSGRGNARLQAQVNLNAGSFRYPDKITVDMAGKKVSFTENVAIQAQPAVQSAAQPAVQSAAQPAVHVAGQPAEYATQPPPFPPDTEN